MQPQAHEKNFNQNLEALRGFAALLVVICHIGVLYNVFNRFYTPSILFVLAPSGQLSVLVFFVLSGFVIAASNKQPLQANTTGAYIKKRLIRLYPIYVIGLLVTLIISVNSYSWYQIIMNFTFLQTVFAKSIAEIAVIWTLHLEVVYYLLFIPLSWLRLNQLYVFIVFLLIPMLIYGFFPQQISANITTHAFGFCFWIAGAYIAKNITSKDEKTSYPVMLSALFLLLSIDQILGRGLMQYVEPAGQFIFQKYWVQTPFLEKPIIGLKDLLFLPFCIFAVLTFSGRKFKNIRLFYWCLQVILLVSIAITLHGFIKVGYKNIISYLVSLGYFALSLVLPYVNFSFVTVLCKKAISFGAWFGTISYAVYIIHVPLIFLLGRVPYFNSSLLSFIVRLIVFAAILVSSSYLLEIKLQPLIKKLFYYTPGKDKQEVLSKELSGLNRD